MGGGSVWSYSRAFGLAPQTPCVNSPARAAGAFGLWGDHGCECGKIAAVPGQPE